MVPNYKLTVVIIDDFTSRSWSEFSQFDIQYYDYAFQYDSVIVDRYGYSSGFDYGDDDSYVTLPGGSYEWVNIAALTGYEYDSNNGATFTGSSTVNPTGLYIIPSDPIVEDYHYFNHIDALDSWFKNEAGHGDWTLKAFTDQLVNPSNVEIIAIDWDAENQATGDMASLFSQVTIDGISFPLLKSLYTNAISDFHQSNEYHLVVGINASFTGGGIGTISTVANLLSDDMVVVQSAPNVNSPGIDWGKYLPNVINVGAWNVDSNGYDLAANIDSLERVDIFANGYIERPGWGPGWSFGTSFASPRVFAEVVNLFDANLLPLLDQGLISPESAVNLSGAEETMLTEQIVTALSSQYLVSVAGFSELLGPINISDRTISDFGMLPTIVPMLSPVPQYVITGLLELSNRAPTGSVTIAGAPTQGQTLTASNTLADIDGLGTISYQWQADGVNISGSTSPTFTLTQAHVGKVITVVASYTDLLGTAENVSSNPTSVVAALVTTPTPTPTPEPTPEPTFAATFQIPVSSIQSIGLSPDGQFLLIKMGGVVQSVATGSTMSFNGQAISTSDLTASITPVTVFKSTGGVGGYTLPDLFTGPRELNLKYQLIETADNAVVIGSSDNDFIKVASANSVGKAVNGGGGNDVIDGGVGSTFITGGGTTANSSTYFLDGRAPGTSWSTITDFKLDVDKATIWGFVKGVSSVDASFTNFNSAGAGGYEGLTLHFKNLLPSGQTSGSNPNLNSITLSGRTLQEFGASSLAELNTQINNQTNPNFLVGATQDNLGTHGYLFIN